MKKKDVYVKNYIKQARDKRGVTLEVLGKKALGLGRSAMSNKENLINPVSLDDLHDIAKFLKCSLLELTGENEYAGKAEPIATPVNSRYSSVGSFLDMVVERASHMPNNEKQMLKLALEPILGAMVWNDKKIDPAVRLSDSARPHKGKN